MNHRKIVFQRLAQLGISKEDIKLQNENFVQLAKIIGSNKFNGDKIIRKDKLSKVQIAGLCYLLDMDPNIFNSNKIQYDSLKMYHEKSATKKSHIYSDNKQDLYEYLRKYFELKTEILSRATKSIYIFHTLDAKFNDTSHLQRDTFPTIYAPMLDKYCDFLAKKIILSKLKHILILQLPSFYPQKKWLCDKTFKLYAENIDNEFRLFDKTSKMQRILEFLPFSVIKYFEYLFHKKVTFDVFFLKSHILQNRFTLVDGRVLIRDSSLEHFDTSPINIMEIIDEVIPEQNSSIIAFQNYFENSNDLTKIELSREYAFNNLKDLKETIRKKIKFFNKHNADKKIIGESKTEIKKHLNSLKERLKNISDKIELISENG